MPKTQWQMYHGDPGHTGLVLGSSISSRTLHSLKCRDVPVAGPIISVPAIVDGIIYVGLANSREAPGANGGQLLKIDARSGSILAQFNWAIDPREGDTHGFMGMGCTPAVSDNRLYFGAFDGKLYCLDVTNLRPVWITDLRHPDMAHNQPVNNIGMPLPYPPAAIWSSPLLVNGSVYVGVGEGENPTLFGFIFSLDSSTGNVNWIYCTCQFEKGRKNQPNVLPPSSVICDLPKPFEKAAKDPITHGCSVWSSIAYDEQLNLLYCATGNPYPDKPLPTPKYSNGVLALDATSGQNRGFFQPHPNTSYRKTDRDVDFAGSPMLFTASGKRFVAVGCKNGAFFLLDAATLKLEKWRQLLPYYNDKTQIPTVDPHIELTDQRLDPLTPNRMSNETDQENYSGTYSTPAVHEDSGCLYIGIGGNNYHNVQAGIDFTTTPFLRAMHWDTLDDFWPMDDGNPPLYKAAQPPMYRTPGESGLSSPAIVNDLVFVSTTKVALYALDTRTGSMLFEDQLGEQTGGINGGYGYCLGPAIQGDIIVVGALVFGSGGILRIYTLPPKTSQPTPAVVDQPSFEQDILPIFRQFRGSMMWRFDLTNYAHVRANAEAIYNKISTHKMPLPPLPALSDDEVELFRRWMRTFKP